MTDLKTKKFPSTEAYREALYDKIAKREDVKRNLYFGPTGVPAIGLGFELLVRGDKPDSWRPREQDKVEEALSIAKGVPIKISKGDMDRLRSAAQEKNAGNTDGVKTEMQGHAFPSLPPGGAKRLFMHVLPDFERKLDREIRSAAGESKELAGKTDAFLKSLENSLERQALFSPSYNNVPMPKAIRNLMRGNRAGAYFEIAYASNKNQNSGIAKRRVAEAADVMGSPDTWTEDQKRQWREVYEGNKAKIDTYDRDFGKWFPLNRRMRDLVRRAGHTLEERPDDRRHTIDTGDTAEGLAREFATSVKKILKAAGVTDPRKLPAGITIVVPEPETVQRTVPGSNAAPSSAPVAPEPGPAKDAPTTQPKPPATDDRSDAGGAVNQHAASANEISPERKALLGAVEQNVDPAEHTVLKHPSQTTRAEIDDVINHPGYWPGDGDSRADAFQNAVRGHFETFHERGVTATPPEAERPVKAIGGTDLGQARKRVADALVPVAERDGLEPTVKGLQRGLNDIRFRGRARKLPNLEEDGEFGPRTLARIDEELVRDGPAWLIDTLRHEQIA